MPTPQPIGRQPGILAPLLLITLFWINGCQSLATQSEDTAGLETRWRVVGQAGSVSLRSPRNSFWQEAVLGVRIAPDSEVATFAGSRLELASAGDHVTASGPSRFTLPETEPNGVRVRQDAGTLRYRVQSAPKRRFEVKTPHFSTVVKGTSFLISTDRTNSEVFVEEGRVSIIDVNGEHLAELTAGQRGRMDARPGATLDVSTARNPSLEPSVGSGVERERSAGDPATFSQLPGVTSASPGVPMGEAGDAEPSLLKRIGGVLGALAAQISTGDSLTSEGANIGDDGGGGAREQENWSKSYQQVDGSRDDENGDGNGKGKGKEGKGKRGEDKGTGKGQGNGKGNGSGKGKGKGKSGEDKGQGKGQGNGTGNGKGNGKGKDHGRGEGSGKGHGQGRGKDAGGGADIFPDRDDPRFLISWNEQP